jgi:hypothetical protein
MDLNLKQNSIHNIDCDQLIEMFSNEKRLSITARYCVYLSLFFGYIFYLKVEMTLIVYPSSYKVLTPLK